MYFYGIKYVTVNLEENSELVKLIQKKYEKSIFPLIFIDGTLFGTVKELENSFKNGSLIDLIPQSEIKVSSTLKFNYLLNKFKVVCFIEGNVDEESENSKKMMNILKKNNIDFQFFNVNSDKELAEFIIDNSKIKEFPQLYFKEKFFGNINFVENLDKNSEIPNSLKF